MRRDRRSLWQRWQWLLLLAPIAGCGSKSSAQGSTPAPLTTIRLVQNPWLGAEVDTAIAAQLLRDKLGYTVEIVAMDETAQWEAIRAGDVHASLEVWPSGHRDDIPRYVTTGLVENAGELGPIGQIGWYTPAYVVDAHPDLASWTGLQDAKNVALFRTPQSGTKGRFLTGDPTWVQYDAEIIQNRQLDFEVEVDGSEDALLGELDDSYQHAAPLLFYFWTPHWAHSKYDLTKIALPDYSDACWAKIPEMGVDCDYPTDHLFKIVWPELRDRAPSAHTLLARFSWSTKQQIDVMGAVKVDNQTVEQAASSWIAANEATWKAWLP